MTSNFVPLWDVIENSTDDDVVRVYEKFREYNKSIGYSLDQLGSQPQDIQGRSREISLLHAILERPSTPVALLLAAAGTGKTALVEQFAKDLNSGRLESSLGYEYLLVRLRVGNLAAIGTSKLQATLSTLFDTLGKFERFFQKALGKPNLRLVLFIDEVHMIVTIFGPGTKIGGDVMKDVLARAPIRIIAATTKREYDSTIAVDKPLAERFKQIELPEVTGETVAMILTDWWEKVAPDVSGLYPDDDVVAELIQANAIYRSDSAEPRKSLDIMEDLVSYSRRTGRRADHEVLSSVFRQRYSINLDFRVEADTVYAEIEKRIQGQPHALYSLRRLLRSMVFQLDAFSNRPRATALFTGSTGTGKALCDDELIPVADERGLVEMGELVIGDRVFSRDGRPVEVSGVFPQGHRQVWRVSFGDGSHLDCDGEHLFTVRDERGVIRTLTVNDMFASVSVKDRLWVPASRPVQRPARQTVVDAHRMGCSLSRTVSDDLASGTDSGRFIPDDYMYGHLDDRLDVISGAFGLDRGVLPGPGARFVTVSSGLAGQLHHLMRSCGLAVAAPTYDGAYHSVSVIEGEGYVSVTSVRPLGFSKPMTCILVDDAEHLFQAGLSHVVTHNTETVKAIAETLYPGENTILHLNMPDFKTVQHEAAFRKQLGEFVRHTPNAVVLMDELEKADSNILDSLLYILDEGRVSFDTTNREGREETTTISLRNTIVIATTNAGQEVFETDASYTSRGNDLAGNISNIEKSDMDQLTISLVDYLRNGVFKPEMLGRFERIIPYRALSEATLLRITEKAIRDLFEKFRSSRGIVLETKPEQNFSDRGYDYTTFDVALFIVFMRARADESGSGGARNIFREIKSNVQDSIVDAVMDHPGQTHFRVYVSEDNAVYDSGASNSKGGVVVEPINDKS